MPCKVSDVSIDAVGAPGVSIPNFGSPFSPIQVPLDQLDLPTELVEELLELMNRLQALFPSGIFKANVDTGMKNVLDFIADILSQIAPFLSFYNFIMAALNLIVCVIEVLCAIPDPLAVASKLKKLFAECLPPFLNLFPWLALLAMILSLILLIIALLEYIITTILGVIEQIIRNIILLQKGLTLQDAESTLAAAQKIAALLCLVENLMAVFIAIAAIVSIIKSLAEFFGSAICDESDEEGCCPEDICPAFIRDNKEIQVTSGTLVYHKKIGVDFSSSGLPSGLGDQMNVSLRPERWQLYENTSDPTYPINLIVTPTESEFRGPTIFFPEQSFEASTTPSRAPYTVDVTLSVDPATFGHSSLGKERKFVIKDCIVVRKPINGIKKFDNSVDATVGSGTFELEGGLVFEEDGSTPVKSSNGSALTLNDFIHLSSTNGTSLPNTDDGLQITDVEFAWKPNHPSLAGFNLITVGCFPEVAVEKAVQNAFINAEGVGAIIDRLPDLGTLTEDVLGTQECVQNSINKFRGGVSLESAETFRTESIDCLTDLKDKVTNVFCDAFNEAVSIFKSEFEIDNDAQFTTRSINVSVTLKDGGGTNISTNIPEECLDHIIGDPPKLTGNVTLGEISDFEYDSDNGVFVAEITSDKSGSGELTVLYDGQAFTEVVPGLAFDTPSSIEQKVLDYTFVDDVEDDAERRGREDVSGS